MYIVAVILRPRNFFCCSEKTAKKTYYKTKFAFVLAIGLNYNVYRQCYLAVNVSCIANTNANFVL